VAGFVNQIPRYQFAAAQSVTFAAIRAGAGTPLIRSVLRIACDASTMGGLFAIVNEGAMPWMTIA